MDVNEHERLSNNALRHKFKYPIIHLDTNSSIQKYTWTQFQVKEQ